MNADSAVEIDSMMVRIFDGYLYIDGDVASRGFPSGVLAVTCNDYVLDVYPLASQASGGSLLKVRDSKGNRSVLIDEVLRGCKSPVDGYYRAKWIEPNGCFRVSLDHRGED